MNFCSGVIFEGNTDEYEDGRRRQTLDGQAQSGIGYRNYAGQDHRGRGHQSFDLAPSEIETWVDDAKKGMDYALRTKPLEVKEQY